MTMKSESDNNNCEIINLISHHGSPGMPSDFNFFQSSLEKMFHQGIKIKLKAIDRFNKLTFHGAFKKAKGHHVGYSWGCTQALMWALENIDQTQGVILVSPYLFTTTPNKMTKTILNMPVISSIVLGAIGKKTIKKMLIQSSAPLDVPLHYEAQLKHYMGPHVLRQSALEKNFSSETIINTLRKLEEKNIPILVLWGENDQTSKEEDQILPLKQFSNITVTKIKNAPHAMLWTHDEEIAREVANFIMLTHGALELTTPFGHYPNEDIRNNVFSFLESHFLQFPDRPILSWVDKEEGQNLFLKKMTVKELYHLVNKTAQGFLNQNIEKGDRALLFLPMSAPLYISLFALQKIGAIPVFLDSWARKDQLAQAISCTRPKLIISIHKAFLYFKGIKEFENIPIKMIYGPNQNSDLLSLEKLMETKEEAKTAAVISEHTALITFTTGSSGTPKGADRSHRFLAAQHFALNRHLPYVSSDSDLPVFPVFSLNNLAAGVETIIPAIDVGQPTVYDGAKLYSQINQHKITCTTLSPSLFNQLSKHCITHNLKLEYVRRIVTGGAPVSTHDVIKMKEVAPHAEILILYGSTEVEPMAHIEAQQLIQSASSSDEGVNVGHLDSGLEYKFIKINKNPIFIDKNEDWKEHEVAPSEVGELIVSGDHVCRYYYNNQEAFYRAKIKDHQGVIWHRTGDLGRLDHQGNLWLVGRVHNAISRKNKYYFPVKAEILLKKLPFVKQSAFLGIPDKKLGEKTVAAITLLHPEELGNPEKIKNYKKEILNILKQNKIVTDQCYILPEIVMDPRHHSKVEYDILKKKIIQLRNE